MAVSKRMPNEILLWESGRYAYIYLPQLSARVVDTFTVMDSKNDFRVGGQGSTSPPLQFMQAYDHCIHVHLLHNVPKLPGVHVFRKS